MSRPGVQATWLLMPIFFWVPKGKAHDKHGSAGVRRGHLPELRSGERAANRGDGAEGEAREARGW